MQVKLINYIGSDNLVAEYLISESGGTKNNAQRLVEFIRYTAYDRKNLNENLKPFLEFEINCSELATEQLLKHESLFARISSPRGFRGLLNQQNTKPNLIKIKSGSLKFFKNLNNYGTYSTLALNSELMNLPINTGYTNLIHNDHADSVLTWSGDFHIFANLCQFRAEPGISLETVNIINTMLDLIKNLENNPFKYHLIAHLL